MNSDAAPRRFAALRNRHSRPYLFSAGLSMMGDNNEHVITYWVLREKFHSPALVGFQVISHWLPFLLLSVWFGSLAERHDCRKLIQIAQCLFMFVSAAWGVLFLTDSLQMWQACVLLVLHGCAGALWAPAEQLMLHDLVERKDLVSAVRLNATFRSLGTLFGPVVGAGLLLGLGSAWGIFANTLIYLPMTILMVRTPFTGHTREDSAALRRQPVGVIGALRTLGRLRANRLLISMLVLSALGALTVGGALHVVMPTFATLLGADGGGLAYSVLLFATGVGGVFGGFLLEATRVLKPSVPAAALSTAGFGAMVLVFALCGNYWMAVGALVVGGVANMASMSTTQSIVQLEAPVAERGRIFGIFGVFSSGMRVGNGITLGVLGALVGIPYSLALCALILVIGALIAWLYARSSNPASAS
jgi:MFS family permease